MDFLRASGRAAGLSLHPLQPADSSHVCTLRRPSPGWRTLPAPMPTGLTTCSRVLPEDRRILVLTSVSFRGAFSGRPTSSDASVRHSCLSRFVAVADPSFIAWLGLWPGESKEFQLLIVVWPLAGDADPSRRPLRSLRDIAESSQECGPFRVAHSARFGWRRRCNPVASGRRTAPSRREYVEYRPLPGPPVQDGLHHPGSPVARRAAKLRNPAGFSPPELMARVTVKVMSGRLSSLNAAMSSTLFLSVVA